MTSRSLSVDVAIVGGGLAGLTAARLLSQRGRRVVVLEAQARLGGRVESQRLADGTVVDLGGQWFGPGQSRVLALRDGFGLASHATFTRGRTAFEFQGAAGQYRGPLPLSMPLAFINAASAGSRLARLGRDIERRSANGVALPADAQSLGAWLDTRVWPNSARRLARFMFGSLFCCELDDVSLQLAATSVHRCGSFEHMLAIRGGAQEQQFSAGASELVHALAMLTPQVRLDCCVERIVHDAQGATLWGSGFEVRAQRVVLAIAPHLLTQIDFRPGLGAARSSLQAQIRMGSILKTVLVFSSPFWRRGGLSGEAWSESGPINGTYDVSDPSSDKGVLVALASARSATLLTSRSPSERRHSVLTAIAQRLGPAALSPLNYVERFWDDEPFIGGGYTVHVPAGAFSGFDALRRPQGVLHWAGTETAHRWPGYMEGALESGERVADEIAPVHD